MKRLVSQKMLANALFPTSRPAPRHTNLIADFEHIRLHQLRPKSLYRPPPFGEWDRLLPAQRSLPRSIFAHTNPEDNDIAQVIHRALVSFSLCARDEDDRPNGSDGRCH